jgi:hypothetical protein
MKKKDFVFTGAIVLALLPFFIFPEVYEAYSNFNASNGMIMSFIKFAVLATLGEVIGLRIKTGNYYRKGFGVIPRAIVWGFLGLGINAAFIIFSSGTPVFLSYIGLDVSAETIKNPAFSGMKLLTSFSISVFLNLIFAPVFMTLHRITDIHIETTGGTLKGFFSPIKFKKHFTELNWAVQWDFVFKKTIPFFWIPAHTITFILPEHFRVLFAAVLGIVLGVFLAVASILGQK